MSEVKTYTKTSSKNPWQDKHIYIIETNNKLFGLAYKGKA